MKKILFIMLVFTFSVFPFSESIKEEYDKAVNAYERNEILLRVFTSSIYCEDVIDVEECLKLGVHVDTSFPFLSNLVISWVMTTSTIYIHLH